MSMESLVNLVTFCSISVESAGSQKMPQRKVILSVWKVLVLRRFLDKMQQMSRQSWMKAFCSISVETVGSQKMHRWKLILLSLWKVRALRRFLDKMQQMSAGSWVKAFCSISVKSVVISVKVTLLCHCGMCGLSEDSMIKCKQMSMRSWVKAFWSISVETAGSQILSLWKVWVLRRFLDKRNK